MEDAHIQVTAGEARGDGGEEQGNGAREGDQRVRHPEPEHCGEGPRARRPGDERHPHVHVSAEQDGDGENDHPEAQDDGKPGQPRHEVGRGQLYGEPEKQEHRHEPEGERDAHDERAQHVSQSVHVDLVA